MEDGIRLECDDECIWPACSSPGDCVGCDDPVVALKTCSDGNQIWTVPVRHSEFYLSEPPFCAHCGGTCKCDDWEDYDYPDGDE